MQEACFRVGDWLFLSEQGLLRDELRGVEVVLTPRAAQLLACFSRHSGEVLGRDALIDRAWTRGEVTGHALTQAIFELRQALRGGREDAPCYIQTVPKRGYRLVAPVECYAKDVHPCAEAVAEPAVSLRRWRGWALAAWLAVAVSVLLASAFFLARAPLPADDSVPNTRRITIHFEMANDERLAALQFGLGGFAAHILATRTPYEVVQVIRSDPETGDQNSARVLMLSIEHVGEVDYLRARFEHRLRQQSLFDKRYPLNALPEAMSTLGADLLQALHYPLPASALASSLAEVPYNSERFFLAYYRMALGDRASLRAAHATLLQVSASPSSRPELLALRGMVELILSDLDAGAAPRWRQRANGTFAMLQQQADAPYFAAPVVSEARAMQALYHGRQAEGEALIAQALKQSETWRAQIVRGKLAELAGQFDVAADAYSRAYLLKPDRATLEWIVHMGYDTELEQVVPPLAQRYHADAG